MGMPPMNPAEMLTGPTGAAWHTLKLAPGDEETARRVHDVHHRGCPVYRSISDCVSITTELELRLLE